MREFDAFPIYPPAKRVANRTIANRIAASYRDKEFYDGDRMNGYGGIVNDGRWGPVADQLIKVYDLKPGSVVLQVGCHKGFLLDEFLKRGMSVNGTEVSGYAISQAPLSVKYTISQSPCSRLPFGNHVFDLVLCVQPVYAVILSDAIKCLVEIGRVGKGKSFITLGTYETDEDLKLMRKWAILGNLILTKEEWLAVLEHVGYAGDYRFDTAEFLGLVEE